MIFTQNVAVQLNGKADVNNVLFQNSPNLTNNLDMGQNFIKNLADPDESDEDYAATVKFVKDYMNALVSFAASSPFLLWSRSMLCARFFCVSFAISLPFYSGHARFSTLVTPCARAPNSLYYSA